MLLVRKSIIRIVKACICSDKGGVIVEIRDDLAIAIHLLQEAKEERDRYNEYLRRCSELYGKDLPSHERDKIRAEIFRDFPHEPKKSIVNDNIKIARRLLMKEYI